MSADAPARPDVRIALVGAEEYGEVDELVRAAYEHDYGPREHRQNELNLAEVRSQRFEVWVARDAASGELVGTVTTSREGGERLVEDARDDELEFRLLAISPTARRRGLGAELTRHVLRLARERGKNGVSLKSAPEMFGAHRLYEALGFDRDPERDGLIVGGVKQFDLNAYVLRFDRENDRGGSTIPNEKVS